MEPLWAACDAWLRRAEEVIGASADALNTLNVFPVSDADTGTNLKLTLRGIITAVPALEREQLDAVVQAAILSAHGNSGAILAEMLTSVCRALQEPAAAQPSDGELVAGLLRRVATAARRAVAQPVAGTILTVADASADAAEQAAIGHGEPLAVVLAARSEARAALLRTPDQLDVLARAGVVDAGGQAFVLLLDVLCEVLGGPTAQPLIDPSQATTTVESPVQTPPSTPLQYEVMYALRGARRSALDLLRAELSELGHSVVIVGDQSIAQVHVHLSEPGAAIEAALDLGRLSKVRVNALDRAPRTGERTVVSMVAGDGLAEAVRSLGGVPVHGTGGPVTVSELSAVLARTCGDVVVLPNDMENLEIAGHLASRLRTQDRRIAVIPTVAQVQGLAAIAVHEPSADFDSAVVAMSSAAGHTRHGAVTIAESSAMTMAGRCQVGDVLGVVESDFTEIGSSVVDVAWRVVQRLLAAGGELVTLVAGVDAEPTLAEELKRRILADRSAVDVELLAGGQGRYLVLIGVE